MYEGCRRKKSIRCKSERTYRNPNRQALRRIRADSTAIVCQRGDKTDWMPKAIIMITEDLGLQSTTRSMDASQLWIFAKIARFVCPT